MKILVTGGAGFVGSTIARTLKTAFPQAKVVALDNLKRRGSELTLPLLRSTGVEFVHGDIRVRSDFPAAHFDFLIECSAEPSVLAGYSSPPDYLLQTNLDGALHCLNFCREHNAKLIFISTSRVYSVGELVNLPICEEATRFTLSGSAQGVTNGGITEDFPTSGPRSLYGATKLAAEMFIEEFRAAYGLQALVLRCGVLTGPWQMARPDQGIFAFWLLKHLLGQPLQYIGFGGNGKQVRDLLHCQDLADLLVEITSDFEKWNGRTFNCGGDIEISLSLVEATTLCQQLTGNTVPISAVPGNRTMDIPYFVMDSSRLRAFGNWKPSRGAKETLADILKWLKDNQTAVCNALT